MLRAVVARERVKSRSYEFTRIRYNPGGITAFLHFSFYVKFKIETQNTFFSKYTSIILCNHQYSL